MDRSDLGLPVVQYYPEVQRVPMVQVVRNLVGQWLRWIQLFQVLH